MTGWPALSSRLDTPFQLSASANAPWTSTIVGFTVFTDGWAPADDDSMPATSPIASKQARILGLRPGRGRRVCWWGSMGLLGEGVAVLHSASAEPTSASVE